MAHEPADIRNDDRTETATERADRNFSELLQELRVAQTGIQILFAFLLTLPFTQRFSGLHTAQRGLYLTTLIIATLALVFLVAPVCQHRILFGRRQKPALVIQANRLAHIGLACLPLAVLGAVFLIVDVVAGSVLGAILSAMLTGCFALTWYIEPLTQRRRTPRS